MYLTKKSSAGSEKREGKCGRKTASYPPHPPNSRRFRLVFGSSMAECVASRSRDKEMVVFYPIQAPSAGILQPGQRNMHSIINTLESIP